MNQEHLNALPAGFRLQEYEILRVLGVGGFGITYLCFDHNLDQARAIKEYLPNDLAVRRGDHTVQWKSTESQQDFESGLRSFLEEAKKLALFEHPNIVRVHRSFTAHGTAYIVMEYAEGETLSAILSESGTLSEQALKNILLPILDGLEIVHRGNFLHRDIKPGNLIIRDADDSPVLLDFGSARQAIESKSRSMTAIVTAGYAPFEQYSSYGNQGPWTDIYALGSLCYRALSGEPPKEAPLRMRNDPLVPLSVACRGKADPHFLAAIDWALRVYEEDRPQSIAQWRAALLGGDIPAVTDHQQTTGNRTDEAATRKISATAAGANPPVSPPPPTQQKPKNRKMLALTAAAWLVVLAGYGNYHFRPFDRITPPPLPVTTSNTANEFRDTLAGGGQSPLMVRIPAGNFSMGNSFGDGDSDELPARTVEVPREFAMSKYEVSQADFRRYADARGLPFPDQGNNAGEDFPVVNVSWQDATDYAAWLSEQSGAQYRLPSEAEWEYAARAGSAQSYPWGDNIGSNMANCNGCARSGTSVALAGVGSYPANAFGLHDMSGNVWEWTQDCARDSYHGAPEDSSVWTGEPGCSRVLRGGSWASNPYRLRSASRNWRQPGDISNDIGIRLVREL